MKSPAHSFPLHTQLHLSLHHTRAQKATPLTLLPLCSPLTFPLVSLLSNHFPGKEHVSSTQHLLKVALPCQQTKNISFSDGCLE